MNFPSKNRSLRSSLIIIGILSIIILGLNPIPAHAGVFEKLGQVMLTVPAWIIYGVLLVVWMIVNFLLTIVAFILNHLFYYNVIMNPMNMPFVIQGWGVTRDIANSFFILIVLWIALTIIFNIEHLGGRKLLVRLIIVALLINFSLAITGAVFGLANAIAIPLRDKIPSDVGGWITGKLALQTTADPPTANNTASVGNISSADCGLSSLMSTGSGGGPCLGADIAKSASQDFSKSLTGLSQDTAGILQGATNLGLSVLILLIVIAAFIIASANLFIRIIAMAMLGVLAPLAFLAFIVPGGKLKTVWDQWISKLFSWAFYAPAFYFLFYLSLLVLSAMAGSGTLTGSTAPIQGNLLRLLPVAIFVGFLMSAVTIGKKMGITTGDAALGVAKMAGVAALTGGAALAGAGAGAIMRQPRVKQAVDTGMEKLSRAPMPVRMALRPVMKKTMEHYEQDQKDVLKGSEQYKNFKATDKLNLFRSTPNLTTKKAAELAHAIGTDKDAMKLVTTDAERQRIIQLTSQFSLQSKVLETNPHLIKDDITAKQYVPGAADRKSAIDETIKRVGSKTDINKDAFSDKDVMNSIIKNIRGNKELQRIGGESPELTQAMVERMNAATATEMEDIKKTLGRAKTEALKRYMNSSPGTRATWSNQINPTSEWSKIHPTYG